MIASYTCTGIDIFTFSVPTLTIRPCQKNLNKIIQAFTVSTLFDSGWQHLIRRILMRNHIYPLKRFCRHVSSKFDLVKNCMKFIANTYTSSHAVGYLRSTDKCYNKILKFDASMQCYQATGKFFTYPKLPFEARIPFESTSIYSRSFNSTISTSYPLLSAHRYFMSLIYPWRHIYLQTLYCKKLCKVSSHLISISFLVTVRQLSLQLVDACTLHLQFWACNFQHSFQ